MNEFEIDPNLGEEFDPEWVPDASSGDGILRSDGQMKEYAKILGCTLRVASGTELFVDLDSEEAYSRFLLAYSTVGKHFGERKLSYGAKITPSKSGLPNRHVVVTLGQELPELARIALQAALSSDPVREILSVVRSLAGETNVVVFFEPKGTQV